MLRRKVTARPPSPADSDEDEAVPFDVAVQKWQQDSEEAAKEHDHSSVEEVSRDDIAALFGTLTIDKDHIRSPPDICITEHDQPMPGDVDQVTPHDKPMEDGDMADGGVHTGENLAGAKKKRSDTDDEADQASTGDNVQKYLFEAHMVASSLPIEFGNKHVVKGADIFAVTDTHTILCIDNTIRSHERTTGKVRTFERSDEWKYTGMAPLQSVHNNTYGIISMYGIYNAWDIETGRLVCEHSFETEEGKCLCPTAFIIDDESVVVAHQLTDEHATLYELYQDGSVRVTPTCMTDVTSIHTTHVPQIGSVRAAVTGAGLYVRLGDHDLPALWYAHPLYPTHDGKPMPTHFVAAHENAFLALTPTKIVYMNNNRVLDSDFAEPFIATFLSATEFVVVTTGYAACRIRITDTKMEFSKMVSLIDERLIGGNCPKKFPSKDLLATRDHQLWFGSLHGTVVELTFP